MNLPSSLWLGCLFLVFHVRANSRVLYEWKYVDYVWNNPSQRQQAIDSGNYATNSCIPYDVDHAPDGRTFVTVVRSKGVPATLSTVSDDTGEGGPLLKPYPDWSWHLGNDTKCDGITSVYRVAIKCNHMFVLDCGKNGDDKVCPAQLLIFDLSTDKLVKRVEIPDDVATNENGTGLLVTPVVAMKNGRSCRHPIFNVFMADVEGYGLVVWKNGKDFTRIESQYFEADPNAETFTVNGRSFQLADGLLGMSLAADGPNKKNNLLYFRPFASYDMYYTATKQLLSKWGSDQSSIEYFKEPTKLTSQSAAQAFSDDGILFFSGITERSILCWNRHKPFTPENIVTVLQNDELLQFASGMKTFRNSVYIMTNRYQNVATNTMNFTDVNFRIISSNIRRLVRGTNCTEKRSWYE